MKTVVVSASHVSIMSHHTSTTGLLLLLLPLQWLAPQFTGSALVNLNSTVQRVESTSYVTACDTAPELLQETT